MNLMKLFKKFNTRFLKENIKKSKALLAFCLGLIPLLNILVLVAITISLNGIEILDFNSLSMITYLGLFIIPIVLAVSLFGFVFKNKSVDFVLSKPLSRSTIYITNIIGGILIITIFMLLNSLIYIFFGLIFSNLVIPFSLILDYFILYLVSYIFIFIVSSLAISIAGNLMGSLVLILTIICLVPFFRVVDIYFISNHQSSSYIKCTNDNCKPETYNCYKYNTCIKHLKDNEYEIHGNIIPDLNFTAPIYSIDSLEDNTFYSTKSIIKMLILIPIYSFIGYYLFNKRKMENNETSFKNSKLHYFIKGITLIPVSFICYLIIKQSDELGFIISIAIILIYSVIYDLITRKEIYKLLKTSIISLITLGLFLGLFGLYDMQMNSKSYVINDIKEIAFKNITIKKDEVYKLENSEITGEDLINRIIKETINDNIKEYKSYTYLNIKTNNKRYSLGLNWSKETDNILKEIENNYIKEYFKNYDYDSINFTGRDIKPTKELKKLIKNTMTNIDNYTYDSNDFLLEVKTYKNHKYETFYIMPNIDKELDKYVMNEKNKKVISFLENNNDFEIESVTEYPLIDYVIKKNKTKFINFLQNNNNEITENTLNLHMYTKYGILVLIGDELSFKEEFKKYEENLKDDEYYQSLKSSIVEIPVTNEDYEEKN